MWSSSETSPTVITVALHQCRAVPCRHRLPLVQLNPKENQPFKFHTWIKTSIGWVNKAYVSKSLYSIYVMHVVMMDLFELLWQLTIEYIFLWHFIFIHHINYFGKSFTICSWNYFLFYIIYHYKNVLNMFLTLLIDLIIFSVFLISCLNFHIFMFAKPIAQVIVFLHFEMCHI
jgi:hypothetical protein